MHTRIPCLTNLLFVSLSSIIKLYCLIVSFLLILIVLVVVHPGHFYFDLVALE